LVSSIRKQKGRSQLFYGQYQYSVSFYVRGAHTLRSLDRKKSIHHINWQRDHKAYSWSTVLDQCDEVNLLSLLDWLILNRSRMRLSFYSDTVTMYTSDRDLLDDVERLSRSNFGFIRSLQFSEAVVDLPQGTIRLRNSRFQYRIYLRERHNTEQQKECLRAWLQAQDSNSYHINPNFDEMLSEPRRMWTRNSFFVDYTDPKFGTMLHLLVPVRKTLTIVTQ
jgi:hypothetical protein